MASIHIQAEEVEKDARTFAPAVVAVGLVLFSVVVTVWPRWSWLPILVVLAGLALWARESIARRVVVRRIEEVHAGHELAPWEVPTVWWFGGAGFAFAQLVFYLVALRVLHAHGLLEAGAAWPEGLGILRGLHGISMTVLMLASAAAAAWAVRDARSDGRGARVRIAMGIALALGLAFLALSALQFVRLAGAGVVPAGDGRLSAVYWALGLHAFFATAGVAALAFVFARHLAGHVPPQRAGPVAVVAAWWITLSVGWILVYLTVYLHALVFPFEIV